LLLLAPLLLFLGGCGGSQSAKEEQGKLATVTRGELVVEVSEGGDLASADPTSIRCPIEGRSTILELIQEGTRVKKGDFLLRLDSSNLEDRLNSAESVLERARSDKAQAHEALEIQRKKNTENIKTAETQLLLARRALEGYEKGQYPLDKRGMESALLLAKADLARAKERAEASTRLFKKEFLSRTELEADELAYKRAQEDVDIAKRRLDQLEQWTRPDKLKQLETDVNLKVLALARVNQQAESELAQRKDDLKAKERAFKLQDEATSKIQRQMEHVVIRAPRAGLVVYGRERKHRYSSSEPISVGKEVREREELLRIPNLEKMVVEVDIHESSIKKIRQGQRAIVSVDAIPGKTFPGTVTQVSLVPSSESSWMNPDLKVYTCQVRLDSVVKGVKPGMHAQARILVADLKDAVQVPLQAVQQSGNRSFVYVPGDGRVELREVQVGANNESMVAILKGLKEGEQVYLLPPEGRPPLPKPAKKGVPGKGLAPASGPLAAAPAGARTSPKGRGRPKLTPEQMKKMRARLAKMSPKERARFLRRFGKGGRPRNTQD